MNSQPSLIRSGRRLQDDRVLGFNQSVREDLLKKRHKYCDVLLRVDEFDPQRHMLRGVRSSLLRMHAMMGAESCLGTQHGCAGNALFEKERKYLVAQIVASGTCIFV